MAIEVWDEDAAKAIAELLLKKITLQPYYQTREFQEALTRSFSKNLRSQKKHGLRGVRLLESTVEILEYMHNSERASPNTYSSVLERIIHEHLLLILYLQEIQKHGIKEEE